MSLGAQMYSDETPFDIVLARAVSADHEIDYLRRHYLKQIELTNHWHELYHKLWKEYESYKRKHEGQPNDLP